MIPYEVFYNHFKVHEHWIKTMTQENSNFTKMLKLTEVFLVPKESKRPESAKSALSERIVTYNEVLESDFNIFNFRILCLLMCRGTPKTKAGLMFDFCHKNNKEYQKTVRKTYNMGIKTVVKRETIM